jgi:glyoxylase-like metal-dependent hydrolase (beta-lactamase superfamily II)
LISSGSDSYLLLGDAAFHAPLSLIFPTSRSLYDVDAQVGIATRKRVIEQVTSERQAIIAYHYPWPGIGRIEKSGEAHRFVPA